MIAKLCARRYAGSWPRAIRHYHASRGTETVDHERWPGARTDRIAGIFKVGDQAAIIVLYRARIAAIVEHRARVIGTPRGFVIEGTAIHDIDAEILTTGITPLASVVWSTWLAQPVIASIARTAATNLATPRPLPMFIGVPSMIALCPDITCTSPGLVVPKSLASPWLSEGSVNLDRTLQVPSTLRIAPKVAAMIND
jgi:hypothetical protein